MRQSARGRMDFCRRTGLGRTTMHDSTNTMQKTEELGKPVILVPFDNHVVAFEFLGGRRFWPMSLEVWGALIGCWRCSGFKARSDET